MSIQTKPKNEGSHLFYCFSSWSFYFLFLLLLSSPTVWIFIHVIYFTANERVSHVFRNENSIDLFLMVSIQFEIYGDRMSPLVTQRRRFFFLFFSCFRACISSPCCSIISRLTRISCRWMSTNNRQFHETEIERPVPKGSQLPQFSMRYYFKTNFHFRTTKIAEFKHKKKFCWRDTNTKKNP